VVGLVVPTGYSLTSTHHALPCALGDLRAQATNTPLTWTDQLAIMAVLILSSKGAAGVTGAGFTTLVATLSVIPNLSMPWMVVMPTSGCRDDRERGDERGEPGPVTPAAPFEERSARP